MCSLDLESCPVWDERVRTARKQHECSCCGQAIKPGEAYMYHSHVFGGSAASEKLCAVCWFVREAFADRHEHWMPFPRDLRHTIRECVSDYGEDWRVHMAVLQWRWRTSASGRKWLRRRWEEGRANVS
jgi:hypothetical protein